MARPIGPKAKLGWLDPETQEFDYSPVDGPNRSAAEATLATLAEQFAEAVPAGDRSRVVTGLIEAYLAKRGAGLSDT